MKARQTTHSEYGKIKSILIKPCKNAFVSQDKINTEWKELNFLEAPDYILGMEEYLIFESILQENIDKIYELPFHDEANLDSIYCRDASIVTDHGLILCNMGKDLRKKEPSLIKEFCNTNEISILGQIESPGTLEGGDTAWIDEQTLAVGHTYRTNKSGIGQLKKLLAAFEINVITVELPHYRGMHDVFHLMSIFSPVDRDVAVVYSPLMPIAFRNELLDRAWHLVEVPENEFESMGCNVLAMSPRNCVNIAGNPVTEEGMIKAGCKVTSYEGRNISYLGGGGPTCLTRPLIREITDTGFG
ncbi:MAG: arginine deiminase family protein [Saprospiraceae bacterium]